jgi:hypothetical protein
VSVKYLVGIVIPPVFAYVFWFVWNGNKNRWLLLNSAMFLVSGLFMPVIAYGLSLFYLDDRYTAWPIFLIALGDAGFDGLQSITHYMLAQKYIRIAADIPSMFRVEPPKPPTACSKTVDKCLMWLNCLSGPLKIYGNFMFRYK